MTQSQRAKESLDFVSEVTAPPSILTFLLVRRKVNIPINHHDCIPINHNHILTSEMAKQWDLLSTVVDEIPPLKDCEVGLLIGYNCSRAMAPRQVISGGSDEPHMVQTDLGWSIVGCSSPCLEPSSAASLYRWVAVEELPPVTHADAIHILECNFKDVNEDGTTLRMISFF